MSGIRLSPVSVIGAVLATGLTFGVALAQSTAPASSSAVPSRTASEPSAATKVGDWTEKQWKVAKHKWSQDTAKWNACNQASKDQNLSGRKSWSFLYDCMTKV
jgi:hypothetical protein